MYQYYSEQYSDGRNFEQNVLRFLRENESTGKYLEDTTDTEADAYEGTDFRFAGMPVDTTLFMDGKDNTVILDEDAVQLSEECTVSYGIRFGNCHGSFKKPVLLIGFKAMQHKEYQQKGARCLRMIESNIQQLLCYGLGLYNSYMATHPASL